MNYVYSPGYGPTVNERLTKFPTTDDELYNSSVIFLSFFFISCYLALAQVHCIMGHCHTIYIHHELLSSFQ